MKRFALLGALAGLLILTIVVAMGGISEVAHILLQAGWPLLWLVPVHLLALWFDAYGWRVLIADADSDKRAGPGFLLWIATVREAVTRLLPTAGIGGELVGIRLASRRIPDGTAVTATVVIEVMVTMFAHYLFALAGVLLLISITQDSDQGLLVAIGLLLSLPVPALFAYALRHGTWFTRLEVFAQRMLGDDHKLAAWIDGARLDALIRALCRRHGILLKTLLWQVGGLVAGTLEVWWGLSLLGHPVGFGEALAIEALTLAARQVAFFIPAGLGVQEAVIVLLGTSFGIDSQTSLALALIKRAREIAFGVPALLSWQWVEWQQMRRHRGAAG